MAGEIIFPWVKASTGTSMPFKWTIGNACYEVHNPELESFDLADLLPHVLEVRKKVISVCAEHSHLGPSLSQVLGRTLATPLRALWDTLISDHDHVQTQHDFDLRLCAFIVANATSEDCHELVQQLCRPSRPCNLSVQAFYYCLVELNGYVGWLPGDELPLTPVSIKQAFYDGMPPTWRERFIQAGHSQPLANQAALSRYFQMQEKLAITKADKNMAKQWAEGKKMIKLVKKT